MQKLSEERGESQITESNVLELDYSIVQINMIMNHKHKKKTMNHTNNKKSYHQTNFQQEQTELNSNNELNYTMSIMH